MTSPTKTERLLVLDDSPNGVPMVTTLLAEHGFTSVWATSQLSDFVQLCERVQPDIIVLSLEALRRQRGEVHVVVGNCVRLSNPGAAVIAMTAQENEIEQIAAHEFQAVVRQPMRHGELAAAIERVRHQVALRREKERQARDFWRFASAQTMQLAAYSFIDPVTGLLNRIAIQRTLEERLGQGGRVGVLFVSIEGLDEVVQLHGYRLAERALLGVAQRYSERLPPGHELGLWGGSELLVVLEDVARDELLRIGDDLVAVLDQDLHVEHVQITLGASIGAMATDDWMDAERMVHKASLALPAGETPRVQYYSELLESEQNRRLRLRRDFHYAIQRNELTVCYQPKVSLRTGEVVGAEALLRWRHRHLGDVKPDHFISLAEESGDIVAVGEWVIGQVVAQAAAWEKCGLLSGNFSVAVNVAPRQLIRPDFAERVIELVTAGGASLSSIEVEVTESGLMMQLDRAAVQLQALRDAGVSVAIDDFGKGESSLAYLKRLPVSTLKIDREFVSDLVNLEGGEGRGMHLARVVTNLAHGLGCKVVAEGVETVEQHRLLQQLGCEMAQGYLFSPALPAQEFMAWWLGYSAQRTKACVHA